MKKPRKASKPAKPLPAPPAAVRLAGCIRLDEFCVKPAQFQAALGVIADLERRVRALEAKQ